MSETRLRPPVAGWRLALRRGWPVAALLALPWLSAPAQTPGATAPPEPADSDSSTDPAPLSGEARNLDDPFAAYEAGRYDQALQGFTDRQVENPQDPAVLMNLGSSYYKMRDFEQAQAAFSGAALSSDPLLAAQAFYNLGNVAFKQGRLEEAVERYQRSLDLNPDDEDAKYNLEFTRDEIRRRIEEAQQRQQQQQQGDQGQQDQQQGQDGQQDQQDQQQGQDGQQQQQQSSQGQDGQQGDQGPDQDQDGLSDATEREGANPTDPSNPDTDGDGLPDGAEDLDRDGEVDEGETDPNNPDSDGDGLPDSQDPNPTQPDQPPSPGEGESQGQPQTAEGELQPQDGEMTPEEAARYLAALEEGRPDPKRRAPKGRASRPAKDW